MSDALCFDTCAVYGSGGTATLLRKLRDLFPERALLIPSFVIAERARQLRVSKGPDYDASVPARFVEQLEQLGVAFPPFDTGTALVAWPETAGRFPDDRWRWEDAPTGSKRPCGQKCRTGDHIVYAIARAHSAVLVTDDRDLLLQVSADGYQPGAVKLSEVRSWVS